MTAKEPLVRVWLADAGDALRALAATPRYSLPALLSLALGIATATAVFAVFSAIVLRPLPFPDEDQLVAVHLTSSTEGETVHGISFTYHAELKDKPAIFAALAGYRRAGVTVTDASGARHASAAQVTPDFFDTLAPGAEVGRTFTAGDPASVVVVSHAYWIAALGGAPLADSTLVVDGKPHTIIGVLADEAALPAHVDMWLPVEASADDKAGRFRYVLGGVGRLAPGVTVDRAREMLRAAGAAQDLHHPDGGLAFATVRPLRDSLLGNKRTSALLMLVAVGAFLLLACANVASLMVTRASLRSRELAIRAAMGAGPATLARQSGLEAVILSLVGAGTGLGLAAVLVSAANRVLASELEYTPARLDLRVVIAFAAIAVVAAIAIGLAPVLTAMRVRPMESLRGEGRSTAGRASRRFRQTLVAIQIAITLVMLTGAATLIRSVARLDAVELGVTPDAVGARVLFPDARKASIDHRTAFARAVVERASHLPGVQGAALASDLPFGDDLIHLGAQLEPGAPKENVISILRLVGPGYFETMQIPILAGRTFAAGDAATGVYHVIVNRAFATQNLGTLAAVGHRISYRAKRPDGTQIWYDVIGVAEDGLDTTVTDPAAPLVYVDAECADAMSLMDGGFTIVARGDAGPGALVAAMASIVREVDRDAAVYDVSTIGDMARRSYRQRTVLELLLGAFALASILVAIVGLYGVTGYTVAERTGEIGIRRALGATRPVIIRMILTETAIVVGLGLLAGLICAVSTRSLLAAFVYGVEPADPVGYAIVCAGIAVVALLAALVPARTAARVLPSQALR